MNRKFKQAVERVGKASKFAFRGSSSSGSRREALLRCLEPKLTDRPIAFQRSDDEEDERREDEIENNNEHGEEEVENNDERGEQNENNEDDDSGEDEDGNEVAVVRRQIRRSHVVAPPSVPVREEDKVLIKPLGDR